MADKAPKEKQINLSPFSKGKVVNRATVLPLGEYEDGTTDLAWPGAIHDPVVGFYNLVEDWKQGKAHPKEHIDKLGGELAGLLTLGGAAMPGKPGMSFGMSGGGKGKGLAPLDWQEQGIKGKPWADGFYSPSLTAAVNLKQGKGTWKDMRAQLVQAGGKPKELAASGIDEHFKPDQVVSREEIAVYLAEHRIETKKRVYDQDENEYDRGDRDYFDEDGDPLPEAPFHRYSEYKSPGGEDYQETVVSLPADAKLKGEIAKVDREYRAKMAKYEALFSSPSGDVARAAKERARSLDYERLAKIEDLEKKQETKYVSGHFSGVKNPLFHYRTQEYDTWSPEAIPKVEAVDAKMPREAELVKAVRDLERAQQEDVSTQRIAAIEELRNKFRQQGPEWERYGTPEHSDYHAQQGHINYEQKFQTPYDDKAAAAQKAWADFHATMPENISWGDESTLLLDELQSDWAQEGRKHGFRDDKKLEAAQKEFDEIVNRPVRDQAEAEQAMARLQEVAAIINGEQQGGKKAQAPYVTSTDDWVALAMKHALIEAARGKKDRLVWAPGKVNAKYYGANDERRHGMGGFYGDWGLFRDSTPVYPSRDLGPDVRRRFGASYQDSKTGAWRFTDGGILGKNLFDILKKVDPEAAKALKIEPTPIGEYALSRSREPGKWDVEGPGGSYTMPFREALEALADENPAYPSVRLPQALRERILAEGLPLWLNPPTAAGPGMVMGGAAQQSPFSLGPGQTEEEPAPLRGSFRQRYPQE